MSLNNLREKTGVFAWRALHAKPKRVSDTENSVFVKNVSHYFDKFIYFSVFVLHSLHMWTAIWENGNVFCSLIFFTVLEPARSASAIYD